MADEVLNLEIAYSNLYRAYIWGNREMLIGSYVTANQLGIPFFHQKVLAESKNVFEINGCSTGNIVPIHQLSLEQIRMNVEGCLNALRKELNQRDFYKTNHTYAQTVLYQPYHVFKHEEILYQDSKGEKLKVSDFLSVSKYAISIAEAIEPSNEEYAKASTAITALQGIDAVLNNKPEDKPVNKMLHLATSFLSSVVKSALKTDEAKRNVTVTTILLDLAIDFLCKK